MSYGPLILFLTFPTDICFVCVCVCQMKNLALKYKLPCTVRSNVSDAVLVLSDSFDQFAAFLVRYNNTHRVVESH